MILYPQSPSPFPNSRAEESPRRSAPLLHDSSPLRPSTIPSSKSRSALAKSIALKAKVLTAIFSPPHGEFLSSWCSPDLPVREEDATLEYDPFAAAGWLFNFYSSYQLIGASSESTFNPSNVPRVPQYPMDISELHCWSKLLQTSIVLFSHYSCVFMYIIYLPSV
nr:nodulin homeobox isoform X1 [Ipomoea batatas]